MPAAAIPAIIGAGASIGGSLLNKKKGAGQTSDSSRTDQYQFDPSALRAYQDLQGPAAGVLQDYMKDPWAQGFFQNAQTRASEQTGARAATLQNNILSPALGAQISNPSAYLASQLGAIGRGASRERADTFANLLGQAEQLRRGAAGAAIAYRPLQTGGTSNVTGTQNTTSGSIWGDLLQAGGGALNAYGANRYGSFADAQPRSFLPPNYRVPLLNY